LFDIICKYPQKIDENKYSKWEITLRGCNPEDFDVVLCEIKKTKKIIQNFKG